MKKLLTISNFILFMFLIVSCGGDSITGGNGGGLPPDNREPAQTDTETSKNYLREHFSQYSRGEVIEEGNTTYTFDGNGDMTISHEGSGIVTTYKFWGMSPNDNKIAYYYNVYNMGTENFQASFMPVSYQDEYQCIKGVEGDLDDKMKTTIFNEDPNKKETDYTKINSPQTSTTEANKWKESVKNREIAGDSGKYKFDANGNLTITYTYQGVSGSENYIFWGAINDGVLHGLYYQNDGYDGKNYYRPTSYTLITSDEINQSYFEGMGLLMHPSKPEPDNSKINPPQTSTEEANKWKDKVKTKSITGNYRSDGSANYIFDNSGNLNIKYQEDEYNSTTGEFTGNKISKTENYTFWGGAEESGSLYGLYYKDYGNGQYYDSMYLTLYNNDKEISQSSYSENIGLIMHPSKLGPDNSKINPTQTSTAEANKWRNSIKNREIAGENEKYKFDANGNLTITFTYQDGSGGERSENYIFWGAKEINQYGKTDLCGLYYQEDGSGSYYYSSAFTLISSGGIKYGNLYDKQLEDIMLGKKTGYDYEKPKTSTTTAANNEWLNKVKSKSIKEKYITTYTFQPNGNVLSSGGQYGEATTYNFWGAIDKTTAIYYEKINIRNIFYNYTIPNSEVWYYYGIKLDTINNKFKVYGVPNYDSLLDSWIQNNFDRNGDPKPNIDWSKMPVQRKDDIDWNNHFIEGNLIKE
ncbi:hypothetical protein [Brachyspira sp.]|uniref:hypothetical protein n=1 Tax=Brachyspira sp. TaxID=1977261 RepID=UPI003D7DABEB